MASFGDALAYAAGNALTGISHDLMTERLQEQKDALEWAKTQREMSLKEEYAIRSEGRAEARKIADEDRQIDPDITVDGQRETRGNIRKQMEANRLANSTKGLIYQRQEKAAGEAEKAKIAEVLDKQKRWREDQGMDLSNLESEQYSPEVLDAISAARESNGATETEKGLIGSAKKIGSTKESQAEAKLDLAKAQLQMKDQYQKQLYDLQQQRIDALKDKNESMANKKEAEIKLIEAKIEKLNRGDSPKEMTANQKSLAYDRARKAISKATTMDEVDAANMDLVANGLDPIPAPASIRDATDKADKAQKEKEALAAYRKERSAGQAVVDILPFTESAKDKAKKRASTPSGPPPGFTATGKYINGKPAYKKGNQIWTP